MLAIYWRLLGKNSKRFVLRFVPCWFVVILLLSGALQLVDGLVPRPSAFRRTVDLVMDQSEPYVILGSLPLAALLAWLMVWRRITQEQRAAVDEDR